MFSDCQTNCLKSKLFKVDSQIAKEKKKIITNPVNIIPPVPYDRKYLKE